MRRKMKKSVDKAVFSRTAKKVAAANVTNYSYRGGIRL